MLGWDCHGLPIELKASSKAKSRHKDALTIRENSRNFALEAVEGQKSEFMSWGVMGDWSKPYLTMDKDFIKSQLRLFFDLMKKGFIYQRFMPVYWSPSSRTALAESELEYNSNVSSKQIIICKQDNRYLFLIAKSVGSRSLKWVCDG
jgi:isoleucyl-tRNA synthetase